MLFRSKWDFDENGTNTKDGSFFLEVVREWEQDFHDRFSPLYANCIYANNFTIRLIQNCITIGNQENRGIIAFEGAFYLGRSLNVENFIISPTIVYAIGSKFDVDKPIWFVRDNAIADEMAILIHDSDSDYVTDSEDESLYDLNPIIHVDAKTSADNAVKL